jgi:plastocyanin
MQRRILVLVTIAVLAVGLAACGSSSKKSGGTTGNSAGSGSGTPANTITIDTAFKFHVGAVKAGATVTVKNEGSAQHTVTSDDGKFDTGSVDQGSSKTFTAPSQPGTYKFHCNIHSFMMAELVVT